MDLGNSSNRFRDFLNQPKKDDQTRCFFCDKTEDDIRSEYYEYMKNPDMEFEAISWDDLIIMSTKLKYPVCAGCYFAIKRNPDLIEEIFNRPENEVWDVKDE